MNEINGKHGGWQEWRDRNYPAESTDGTISDPFEDPLELEETRKSVPLAEPVGHIYFISDGDAVKIGFSTQPKRRLSGLQTGHSKELAILGLISASVLDELELHERFQHIRIRGEWFKATPELHAFIKETVENPPSPKPLPEASSRARTRTTWDEIRDLLAWGKASTVHCAKMYTESIAECMLRLHRNPDDADAKITMSLAVEALDCNRTGRRPSARYEALTAGKEWRDA